MPAGIMVTNKLKNANHSTTKAMVKPPDFHF
jgi:hypothetical protein